MERHTQSNAKDNVIARQNKLLEAIVVMQQDFLKRGIYYGWCENTLNNLIRLTESKIGFICELYHREDGTPFIKSHGISNIAWDEKSRLFYQEHYKKGLEFYNFDSLWGAVFNTGEAVISNNPDADSRRGGYPEAEGHPKLKNFLGLPIKNSNGELVGIMGVANRSDGYDPSLVDFLHPFLSSYGLLIEKFRLDKLRKNLENEREKLITDLNNSLEEIKTLRGIVPICSFCKQIRDDEGFWNQVEEYLSKHTDAKFSHSVCPRCMKIHYPEKYASIESKTKK